MSVQKRDSFFDRLMQGMQESLGYSRGELNLRTTTLPAPPPRVGPPKLVALRKKLRMSQSVFAATLNVSTKLVQSWEQGLRNPEQGTLRLIELLMREPAVVSRLILGTDLREPKGGQRPARKPKQSSAA
jgi:putative transcriptional regulator